VALTRQDELYTVLSQHKVSVLQSQEDMYHAIARMDARLHAGAKKD
jgi:hypothetical protein